MKEMPDGKKVYILAKNVNTEYSLKKINLLTSLKAEMQMGGGAKRPHPSLLCLAKGPAFQGLYKSKYKLVTCF